MLKKYTFSPLFNDDNMSLKHPQLLYTIRDSRTVYYDIVTLNKNCKITIVIILFIDILINNTGAKEGHEMKVIKTSVPQITRK